ncbi:hypothetical protein AHMF7605_25360 [Adhaeribacter arboris]|uniref:Mannan endo-1,4-beta-mannosidase n=1 Tax=Adhaeribacter arboris TaxID=2072846 RepID=A0A2T2YM47_9BACT|nr:glycosyl hydrolase [Adhaeribacter arboris]PSR56586.1 hypothetical protein AHMF7605_25360 [Adhaeribacter arboris]
MMQQIYLWMKNRGYNFSIIAVFALSFFITFLSLAQTAEIKSEAENASHVLTGLEIANAIPGFSGTGYAWGFDNSTDNILFNFSIPTAGKYELSVIYTSPYGEKKTSMQLDQLASTEQQFLNTGQGFNALKTGAYELTAGQHTLRFTHNWGYYGIDYILVKPVASGPLVGVDLVDGKAEAEVGILSGVAVATTPTGYTGSGYVNGFDNATDKLTIHFNGKAGLYELQIGYTAPYGEKGYDFSVNAETGSGMFANTGNTFSVKTAGKFLLHNGVNTFTLNNGWGYYGIDYIKLIPSIAPLPVKPPKQLVDAQASQATRALFSYLIDQYGTKTLSGQQDDVDYVLQTTGKEPAIGAFDLIDYSPSRIENGANPEGTSERYIAWAKKNEGNGIITLAWHWNAPTDLINEAPDKLWWSGFYTRATTFDLAAALANKQGEKYKLLIRDIDAIAVQLKKFQDADVSVLWRPLHEAAGTWFWWGAKGPEAYKELWRILYDRLQNHHQLHNLIWVFTSDTKIEWYPGDAYVDVIGMDIYTNAADNMSGNWASMMDLYGGRKLVTLSESGTLPIPDRVRGYGTWWSWFAIWNGEYIKNQPVELLKSVYNDEDVITRNELPNWRVYGRPTVSVTDPANNGQFLVCETPVLTAQAADKEGRVTQVAFWASGTLLGTDTTPGDGWKLEWKNAPVGTYQIIAEATDNEGNSTKSTAVTITVKPDVQAPVIALKAPKLVIPAEDHLLKTISLSSFIASVTDNCGPAPIVRVKSVSSDEAATGGGSGNTKVDIIISPDGQSVQVRAERAGTGDGRVYVLTVEALDRAGNVGLATYQVQIPKSASKPAIAGTPVYTVTGNYAQTIAARQTTSAEVPAKVTPAVKVYPNPAKGNYLTVEVFAAAKQEVNLTLRNTNSQNVVNSRHALQAGVNHIQVPLAKVTDGFYMLQVQDGKEVVSRKVIISKQ